MRLKSTKQKRFRTRSLLVLLCSFLFVLDAVVAQTNTYSSKLFPTPEILKPNVEFWKNIYSKHSERDVVIHDSENLGVVYQVVNLDSLFRGLHISRRLQWKKIENIKKGYRAILLKLSRRKNLRLESLKGKDKAVAALFGKELSSKRLRRAARNIRAQNGLRERFELGLKRSGLYIGKMREIFLAAGLPLELLVLPHVESSFNYQAYSKFGAAGVWQFTRSTGRRYMKINYEVDERLDPIRATQSAAKLLKANYQALGSWPLAITAYNHGRAGMKRAKRRYGNDLSKIVKYYRSRSFGFASRNFYSEFLAALHVANNYRHFFGEIDFYRPREYTTFVSPDYVSVKTLSKTLGIEARVFAEFNPALRRPVLQSRRRIPKNFTLRIPLNENLDIEAMYAKISPNLKHGDQVRPEWHKVRRGEHLSSIARKYRIRLSELMAVNNIRNANRIYVGQNLQLPFGSTNVASISPPQIPPEAPKQLADATGLIKKTEETVLDVQPVEPADYLKPDLIPASDVQAETEKPDSKTQLSAQFDINPKKAPTQSQRVEEDMELALPGHYVALTRSMDVRVMRVPHTESAQFEVRDLAFPENGQVTVEPDETIGHFADWLGVRAAKIRTINRLSYWQPIRVGQPIWLTFENVTPEEFHRRRLEYHQGIEEDFYRNFSIEGEKTYKVVRGENIWVICNRKFELPYWLVQKHNPGKDLLRLMAGETIIIPIVEETALAL